MCGEETGEPDWLEVLRLIDEDGVVGTGVAGTVPKLLEHQFAEFALIAVVLVGDAVDPREAAERGNGDLGKIHQLASEIFGEFLVVANKENLRGRIVCGQALGASHEHERFSRTGHAVEDAVAGADGEGVVSLPVVELAEQSEPF